MKITKTKIHAALLIVVLVIGLVMLVPQQKKALALGGPTCVCCSACELPPNAVTFGLIIAAHELFREAYSIRVNEVHEWYLDNVLFDTLLLPAWQNMTEQLVTTMMHQMLIVGTFFDARHQMETQRLTQRKMAEAHKDYHPSLQMCEFGTNVRSLGAATHNANLTKQAMAKRFEDRMLGKGSSSAGGGPSYDFFGDDNDYTSRLKTFEDLFCDYRDMNKIQGNPDTGLFFCDTTNKPRVNADIDFTKTIMMPSIIDVDMALDLPGADPDRPLSGPEVFEMANYLYGHDVFSRIGENVITRSRSHDEYVDMRAVIAKRSVAQNTFASIVSYKTRGSVNRPPYNLPADPTKGYSTGSFQYMENIFEQMGVPADQVPGLLGGTQAATEISYYAQMEILAKKLYQRPEFYTNLYDKPANLKRTLVSMQAIDLMLDRDIYDSYLRSEALLSLILETQLINVEQEYIDQIKDIEPL